jgi:hypothetical protein
VSSVINTSDARLKKDIVPSDLGLAFVETLHPVSYKWVEGGKKIVRVEDGEEEIPAHWTIDNVFVPPAMRPKYKNATISIPGVRTHYGLIAQDVRQAVAAAGVADFGGYVLENKDDPLSTCSLRYDEFIAPLIKAVQELSARVKSLEAQLARSK